MMWKFSIAVYQSESLSVFMFVRKLLPPSHYWNLQPVGPEVRSHRSGHAPMLRRAWSGERARSRDTFLSEKRACHLLQTLSGVTVRTCRVLAFTSAMSPARCVTLVRIQLLNWTGDYNFCVYCINCVFFSPCQCDFKEIMGIQSF